MTNNIANNKNNEKIALVLGATGGIGGEVACLLVKRGWTVRALNRDAAKAAGSQPELNWLQGDAMNASDVLNAAKDATLIVHAVNPAGYRNWGTLVLPMLDNTITAAKSVGATVILPGTIYNFGPDAFPVLHEDAAQNPVTVKGSIRVEMERRLKLASESGVRVIIVRAGDFFGPKAGNNWFSQGMITPGIQVDSVTYPGKRGIGHQWAYLPDTAETMMRLVEKGDTLPVFAAYHMEGFWDHDGTQLTAAIRRVVDKPDLKIKSFPWWILPFLAPFNTFMKEAGEMKYLWKKPLRMPNTRLVEAIGPEPRTPIDEAMKATLTGLGCLPDDFKFDRDEH
ncbi:NAD(P)H-binding protein [Asticcacaulis benevestitus]|uniref:NAD(P)-binding domain-containing protein n=1 Tax=Asticcacaulis benevestitus DSM 16100 = ATCC BAA-896 TaxID=1121022 RepID=V4PEF2_9CAUL|nr:NAD(P)H-binding protein [Asticcacaulis benevestitus]ESQ86481.1 hypothetical protein ABENE_18330 [Asticcacaulis benevestitus DSM 16100 = ATCC BAA-896]